MADEAPKKKKRFRSPPYPSFDLGRAVERVTLLDKVAQHHEVGVGVLTEAWGMKSADGQVWRTAAALIQYGLVTDSGTGKTRKFRVSDSARRIVRDPNPDSEKRRAALQSAALLPMIHKTLWNRFGAAAEISDSVIKAYLTLDRQEEGDSPYSDSAADEVIASYRKTLEFAGLTSADSIQSDDEDDVNTVQQSCVIPPDTGNNDGFSGAGEAPNPPTVVRVGDFVQWESQGSLQFETPRKVRWVSDDKSHIAVDGSDTGIPVEQVIVEPAPAVPPPPLVKVPPADPKLADVNVTAGQRKAVFPVSDGDVTFIFPEGLTSDGIEELEAYLAVFLKKEKRLAAGG